MTDTVISRIIQLIRNIVQISHFFLKIIVKVLKNTRHIFLMNQTTFPAFNSWTVNLI